MNRIRRSVVRAGLATILAASVIGCGIPPVADFPSFEVAFPPSDEVDEVLFLVGDAGEAIEGRSPILQNLSTRVEHWSREVARDSSVSVVFLGDIVYEVGVHDRDHPEFPQDSTHLWAQVGLVGGTEAMRRGSLGLFVPGNHDWGNLVGERGVQRLRNLDAQLELARSQGIRVDLLPTPGSPGPEVVDLRNNTRLIAIDTHWFLQEGSSQVKDEFLVRVLEALQDAGDRHVVFVAHHPYSSAGSHGELEPGAKAVGLVFLLKRSGTLVQDLNSPVYADLINRLRIAFVSSGRVPLVWAGGHDHSLQVIHAQTEWEPSVQLVSGSASKRSAVGSMPALEWGASQSGYMILFLLKDGSVRLFVVSSESDVSRCPEEPEAERLECMEREAALFVPRYSEVVAPATDQTDPGGER